MCVLARVLDLQPWQNTHFCLYLKQTFKLSVYLNRLRTRSIWCVVLPLNKCCLEVDPSKTLSCVCTPLCRQLQNRFARHKQKKQISCLNERLHPAGGNLVNQKWNKCSRRRSWRCCCNICLSQCLYFHRCLHHILSHKSQDGCRNNQCWN